MKEWNKEGTGLREGVMGEQEVERIAIRDEKSCLAAKKGRRGQGLVLSI